VPDAPAEMAGAIAAAIFSSNTRSLVAELRIGIDSDEDLNRL